MFAHVAGIPKTLRNAFQAVYELDDDRGYGYLKLAGSTEVAACDRVRLATYA